MNSAKSSTGREALLEVEGSTLWRFTSEAVVVWPLGGIEAGATVPAVALTMWAPALGRFVTLRTVDVGWRARRFPCEAAIRRPPAPTSPPAGGDP